MIGKLRRLPELCYIGHPDGKDTGAAEARAEAGFALLSQLRGGGNRPSYMRGLFCRHLPALRNTARISRRARNRITL